MSQVYERIDAYVRRFSALDPILAGVAGVTGLETELTDYSPAGLQAQAALQRETLASMARWPVEDERDRLACAVLRDRLEANLAIVQADEPLRELRIISSPLQRIRQCFDGMPQARAEDWERIAIRMEGVPQALAGFRATLEQGLDRGLVAAQRQALACAQQAAVWGGQVPPTAPFFQTLAAAFDRTSVRDAALKERLARAALGATASYATMSAFLRHEYAPRATERDAVGPERYALHAYQLNGLALELHETYAWGWAELQRIEHEMAVTAARIAPDMSVAAVMELLDSDPARVIDGVEAYRVWLQTLEEQALVALDGVHFDIPAPLRRIEAQIPPPGGALIPYYRPPTEDFSQPGRVWFPTGGKTRFPRWTQVSIAYHEGVPGHHLQFGYVHYLGAALSAFQRLFVMCNGYVEGWALYAERLMAELGFFDTPDSYLGMLAGQAARAVRVIVDIGLHLELAIPAGQHFHPGERWTADLAKEFLRERSGWSSDLVASEVDRYLGWPGQAICYKVGERVWLAARDDARRRSGPAFDRKAFHMQALARGPMGLAQLQQELAVR